MKKHYLWLLFDADGTLFDYNRAEVVALESTFQSLGLPFSVGHLDIYQRINQGLWQSLERGEIEPDVLQVRRFELLLETLRLSAAPDQMSAVYIEQLGLRADLLDGAYEVLRHLRGKSRVAIVTNGLQAVQSSRLAHSTIRDFIEVMIISEDVGAAKPQSAFFDAAFERLGRPTRSDVLVVGDSLTSDIQGGVDYGVDTCWFNPTAQAKPDHLPLTYEISHLLELLDILD